MVREIFAGALLLVHKLVLGFVPIALSMSALPFLVIRSSFAVAIVIGRIGLALFDFLVPFSMMDNCMDRSGDQQKKTGLDRIRYGMSICIKCNLVI